MLRRIVPIVSATPLDRKKALSLNKSQDLLFKTLSQLAVSKERTKPTSNPLTTETGVLNSFLSTKSLEQCQIMYLH